MKDYNLTLRNLPVSLVPDLRITHDRVGSSVDPTLNGHLRYPNNLDRSLDETVVNKEPKYHTDYNTLTTFSQFQEFNFRKQIVESSTTTTRLFLLCSNLGLEIFSPKIQFYVLILI
jgi:hypothetical protein